MTDASRDTQERTPDPGAPEEASTAVPPPRRSWPPRARVVVPTGLVVLGLVLVAGGVAWRAAPHPAMDLSGTGDIAICAARPTAAEQDVVTGNLTFRPPRDVELVAVRLVEPVNVTLADAEVAATVLQAGGGGSVPGLAFGWPLTPADRATYTLDWSTERDLAGATLRAGVEEAPILHLRITDPTRDASFSAWQVEYRMDGTRRVSTFTHSFRMSGTVGADECRG